MSRVLKAANWGLDRIIDGSGFLGIVIMISLSIFVALVMLSRHVLALNLPGFFDAAMYSLIIFPFATAAYALRAGKHVRVDIFVNRLPERAQAALRIITYLASMIFLIVLVWQAQILFSYLFSSGTLSTGVWQIPKWILVGFILFGGLLLILQIIRIVAKDFRFFVSDKSTISPQGLLCIAGFIIGIVGAAYLMMQGNEVIGVFVLLGVVLFSGMPVFLALGILGTMGLFFAVGSHGLMQVPQTIFGSLNSFPLTCLPLFIFAGIIMERGKLIDELFRFVEVWIGHFTPSLLLVTIVVGMIIASLTGSTTAATAMLAATALPVLISRGFKKSLGCGLICASASGSLIPPSLGYVIYAVLVEESIGQLFIAALIPAIMIFNFFTIYILIVNIVNKKSFFEGGQIPSQSIESVSLTERFIITRKALWVLFAPVLVLGSIYLGIFTPTESAAALLLYSIFLCVFKKTLNWRDLYRACSQGALIASMILCILATAFIFAKVISQLRVTNDLINFAETVGLGPTGVVGIIFVTLLILGMVMSAAPIKPITLPIFYPLAMAVGINPLWLGVFYQIMNEMGTLTPPFGLDFFIIKSMLDVPYNVVLKGVLPFIALFILSLIVLFLFPQLATWLPSTMR